MADYDFFENLVIEARLVLQVATSSSQALAHAPPAASRAQSADYSLESTVDEAILRELLGGDFGSGVRPSLRGRGDGRNSLKHRKRRVGSYVPATQDAKNRASAQSTGMDASRGRGDRASKETKTTERKSDLVDCSECKRSLDMRQFNKTQRRRHRTTRVCVACQRKRKEVERHARDVAWDRMHSITTKEQLLAYVRSDISRWQQLKRKEKAALLRKITSATILNLHTDIRDCILFQPSNRVAVKLWQSRQRRYRATCSQFVDRRGQERDNADVYSRLDKAGYEVCVSYDNSGTGSQGCLARRYCIDRVATMISLAEWKVRSVLSLSRFPNAVTRCNIPR